MSTRNFIKRFDENLYKEYLLDLLRDNSSYVAPVARIEAPQQSISNITKKMFYAISELPASHKAYDYIVNKRKIPQKWLNFIYYIEDFKDIFQIFTKYDAARFKNDGRIVVPYFSSTGNLNGVSCRSLVPNDFLRYIKLKIDDTIPDIFNLAGVDKTRNIYVLEGAFDSCFIQNAVAVNGSNLTSIDKYLPKDKCVLIFDYQPRNPQIVKLIEKAINDGYRVCLLPEFPQGSKDINDLVVNNGYTEEMLMNIINNNISSGVVAKINFIKWKRI